MDQSQQQTTTTSFSGGGGGYRSDDPELGASDIENGLRNFKERTAFIKIEMDESLKSLESNKRTSDNNNKK